MSNPYAAPEVTPELAAEERRRPKFLRRLVVAYAVHHLASVLGIFTGVLLRPGPVAQLDDPQLIIQVLVFIPLLDVFVILEPVIMSSFGSDQVTFWHWVRIPVTLAIPAAGFMYSRTQKSVWLGVVAILSYGVFVSLILWAEWQIARQ